MIPPDASLNVQNAFQDLQDRIVRLEAQGTVQPLSQDTLDQAINQLRRELLAATRKPNFFDDNDNFRGSGGAGASGYVPNPGEQAGYSRVLQEDGKWRELLGGDLERVEYPGIALDRETSFATALPQMANIYNLKGDLAILGAMMASRLDVGALLFRGTPFDCIVKTMPSTVDLETAGNTLVNLTDLAIQVEPQERWIFFGAIGTLDIDAAADLDVLLTIPASSTISTGLLGAGGPVTSGWAVDANRVSAVTTGAPEVFLYFARFENGANAGTVQVQAAQNNATATGTSVVAAGSFLVGVKYGLKL